MSDNIVQGPWLPDTPMPPPKADPLSFGFPAALLPEGFGKPLFDDVPLARFSDLSVFSYGGGTTLWIARLPDVALNVAKYRKGFWSEVGELLTVGDIVMVSARDGASILTVLPFAGGDEPHLVPLS